MYSPTFGHRLGALASRPGPQDLLITSFPRTASKRPKAFTERAKHTPVKNQGNAGTCEGFAGVATLEVKDVGEQTVGDCINLSEMWAYTQAKKIDGYPTEEGTDSYSMCQVMLNTGFCEDQLDPYSDAHPIVDRALPGAVENAAKFKIQRHASVTPAGLRDAIWQRGSLLLAIKVYSNFGDTGSNGLVPSPRGRIEGGHALCLVGYEDGRCCNGWFEIKNSWGPSFGDKGYVHISYKDMAKIFMDARSIVDLTPATLTKLCAAPRGV